MTDNPDAVRQAIHADVDAIKAMVDEALKNLAAENARDMILPIGCILLRAIKNLTTIATSREFLSNKSETFGSRVRCLKEVVIDSFDALLPIANNDGNQNISLKKSKQSFYSCKEQYNCSRCQRFTCLARTFKKEG